MAPYPAKCPDGVDLDGPALGLYGLRFKTIPFFQSAVTKAKLIPFFVILRPVFFFKGRVVPGIHHPYCRLKLEIRALPTVPSLPGRPAFKRAEPVFN